MKIIKIDTREAEFAFQKLSKKYKIIAPIEKVGKGRFSNTNLITYDEVKSFEEIEFFKKTYFSAKSVLFPTRQVLFEFQADRTQEIKEEIPHAVVFLRACDINAITVTDTHFLKGDYRDNYYKQRRETLKFFLIECSKPFESCFCVSMGTNKTEDYSVFVRKVDTGYEVGLKDQDFREYFFQGEKEFEGEPNFVEKDIRPLSLPKDIDVSIFKSDLWNDYSLRCSACGRCNTSCPTCSCFTVQDIPDDNKEGTWQRTRIWSSCQVKNFSLLAGNHDFRIPKGDRMRYKVLHKIRDFKKRTGFHMCVGCGRCDDICPEYISIFKCVEKINQIITQREQ